MIEVRPHRAQQDSPFHHPVAVLATLWPPEHTAGSALFSHQPELQIPFFGAVLQPLNPKPVYIPRVVLCQVQNPPLALINFMKLAIAELPAL